MLRTNSKKAKQNIQKYIIDNFDSTNYKPDFDYIDQAIEDNTAGRRNVNIFSLVAHAIIDTFGREYLIPHNRYNAGRMSAAELFEEWAAGLPSILDTCYYYNRSAVDDLGAILEETEAEKTKYNETQAEQLLTRLIYREIYNATH